MDSELKKKLKSKFVLFALIILLIGSIILNINSYSKIDTIERGITGAAIGFLPNYECKGRQDIYPNGLYCFDVTESKKTCYTLPDRTGGKRCSVEPYWEKLTGEPEIINPPTHTCLANGKELYCYDLSNSKKTCYTKEDRTGGVRCLTDPYWKKIGDCPEAECPLTLTCGPCVQTCKGCGSGSGPGPSECAPCIDCDNVIVLAYTDNGKEFCTGIGYGQTCINERDLSTKQLDELGW